MEIVALKDKILSILDSKKAQAVECLEVGEKTSLADYFIIATATSVPHAKTLADEVEFRLKTEDGILPRNVEGRESGRWILLDYGDVVLHVFHHEERAFYRLEQLWEGATPDHSGN